MVDYKVRVFYEPDNDSVGAEVRIYSDNNEEIDKILITTESKYKELERRLDELDINFVNREDLLNILMNTQEDLIAINATSLGGLTSDQYAKTNHNELHTNYFAPIDHALTTSKYGLGDDSKYGHVKLVDNLNSEIFRSGEALSARQGSILKNSISNIEALLNPQILEIGYTQMFKDSSGNYRFTSDSTIKLTKIGKLVICFAKLRTAVNITHKDTDFHVVTLPNAFKPRYTVAQDWSHYQHNAHGLVSFQSDGDIKMRTNTENAKPVAYVNVAWVTV